jgi:integrase
MSEKRSREAGPKKDPRTGTWGFVTDVAMDEHGRRKQARRRGFKTRADAQRELDRLRVAVRDQTFVAPARQTFGDFLDEWLETITATVQPSTLASYRRNVRVHVKPALGGVQLQKLDAAHLNRAYVSLRDRLSVRTVRYIHTINHRALRDAVKWGRLVRNPADAADPPRAKDAKHAAPEMRTWDAATLGTFLKLVEKSRYRVPWLVLATTGMRRGEVLGLRWRDIDLDAGRLTIRQTITLVDHKIVIAPRTKTGNGRAIDLDAATVAELRAHRAWQARELLLLGIRADADTLVFSLTDGRSYNPDRFSREFDRALERHPDVPRIRLHDLRHTWATLALVAGVPVKVVSERLGHATTAITLDIYSHVTPTMQADAAERVSALIFGAARPS